MAYFKIASESPLAPAEQEAKDRHFQDLYSIPPDFKELGRQDPDLAAVLKGRELDFEDPASVMQLTKTLLKLDFDLKLELPDDRLCPPVANRHNYILWLKKLLDTSSYEAPGRKAIGIDIGTGASCIYPLLGCVQRPWSFIATDIDEKSLQYARKNTSLNNLSHRIQILSRTNSPQTSMIPLQDAHIQAADFTMTNPPFYTSRQEMLHSATQKARKPFTACTGADTEMVTEGGELRFAERILEDSLVTQERVQWYTCMFGFLASVTGILERLRQYEIDNFAVTEFVQGSKTRRWAVGWSFQAMRPAQAVARGITSKAGPGKIALPKATEIDVVRLPFPKKIGAFADSFGANFGSLDLVSWDWDKEKLEGIGRAVGNVWNRAYRRKQKREVEIQKEGGEKETEAPAVAFGFLVWIRVGKDGISIGCRWLEGHDTMIFDSFQGFVKSTATKAAAEATPSV